MVDNANNQTDDIESKKQKIELERLKTYFRDVISKQDFKFDEYSANVAKWKELTGEEFNFDILLDENKQDVLQADEEIAKNIEAIDAIYEQQDVKQHFVDEVAHTKAQVAITYENGNEVDGEQAHELLSSLMFVSREEITARLADSKSFAKLNAEEKKRKLIGDTDVCYNINVATAVSASAIDVNKDEEENARAVQQAAEDYMSGKHVAVRKDGLIASMSNSVIYVKEKSRKLSLKGFIKSAKKLKSKIGNFVKLFNKKNLGQLKDGVIQDVKANPWQYIANTAASVAVTGATLVSAPVALVAVAGYAAYNAASTPLWNLNRKRNLEQLNARKQGKDGAEWSGWDGIKKAWKAIKDNPQEKKTFNRQWRIAAGTGIVSGAVVGALSPVAGLINTSAANSVILARAGTGFARIIGANANAVCAYNEASSQFKATGSEYDESRKNMARTAMIATGLLTTAIEAVSVYSTFSHINADDVANAGVQGQDGNTNAGNDTIPAKGGNANANANGGADNGSFDAGDGEPCGLILAPTEYDPSMGISEKHWNEMQSKIVGIYANQSAIFGKEDVPQDMAWDNMYSNLDNAMRADPDMFGSMTKEQVLYKYMKLIENCERAKVVHGGYLVTKLGADGLPTYGSKEMTDFMRSMNSIIICGEDKKLDGATVSQVMSYVNERNGIYSGPGAGVGGSRNVLYVGGRVDCEDYQNAWKSVGHTVHHVHHAQVVQTPVQAPEPTPEPVAKPIDEVVVNQEINKPIDEVVTNQPKQSNVSVRIIKGSTDGNQDVHNPHIKTKTYAVDSTFLKNEGRS